MLISFISILNRLTIFEFSTAVRNVPLSMKPARIVIAKQRTAATTIPLTAPNTPPNIPFACFITGSFANFSKITVKSLRINTQRTNIATKSISIYAMDYTIG